MRLSWAARFMGAALPLLCLQVGPAGAADAPRAAAPAASAARAAARLEDYLLLALSPSEGVAVLRGPDRQLVTLRAGTALPAARARLVQVLGDRLRFDTADEQGVRQVAWMIRAANPEQPPEVQRVSATPPPRPAITSTAQSVTVPLRSGASAPK